MSFGKNISSQHLATASVLPVVYTLLLIMLLVSLNAVELVRTENCDAVRRHLLSIPNDGNKRDLLVASAMNTRAPVLCSTDGSYAWQFVPYQNNKSRLLVVQNIAYNATIIWIANRNHPVSPNASLIVQLPSRIFLLQDVDGSIAWSPPVKGISAVLMNASGNLIMYNAHNATIWESFDNATDVLVAGQTVRTNHSVVSRLSLDDVSEGLYTLRVEPGGVVLYASFDWQQHMVAYASDTYAQGLAISSGVSVQTALHSACNRTNLMYSVGGTGFELQQEGSIVTPQCRAEEGNIADDAHGVEFGTHVAGTGLRFIRVMPNGDLNTFLATNSGVVLDNQLFGALLMSFCRLPSYCGVNSLCSSQDNCTCPNMFEPIDRSGARRLGCQLVEPLNCSISSQHQFLAIQGLDYFANAYLDAPTVASADECQSLCRANCSCTAAFYRNDSRKCHLYDQVQTMMPGRDSSITAFLRVAKLPVTNLPASAGSISKKVIIIGVTSSVAMVLVISVLVGWIGCRIMAKPNTESDSEEEAFLESLPGLPPRFTYKELHSATEGFSKKLGTGGSGTVYEGHIPPAVLNNKQLATSIAGALQQFQLKVAVKELQLSRFPTIAASGKKQFRAEVATLGSLSHVNLVHLRGFCAEGTHRLLIYEFLENGSLDRWIFNAVTPLEWEVRYRIAVDTARGLAFLHEASRDKVVHLDVKPQNILLDADFRAKLADFGLCKLVKRDQGDRGAGGLDQGAAESQTVTAMRGTPGYMAPEWFLNLPVTDRSDVFSYGMVLLELVGGRKNLNLAANSEEEWYMPAWAVQQAQSSNLWEVIDEELRMQHANMDQSATSRMCAAMSRLLRVAFWCIQENAESRPSMSTVLLMLEERLQVPEPPLNRTYIVGRQSQQRLTSTSTITRASTPSSGIISEVEPR